MVIGKSDDLKIELDETLNVLFARVENQAFTDAAVIARYRSFQIAKIEIRRAEDACERIEWSKFAFAVDEAGDTA